MINNNVKILNRGIVTAVFRDIFDMEIKEEIVISNLLLFNICS